MMQLFSSILIASTFTIARARIQGLSAPSSVRQGDEITVNLLTTGYIHKVADVAVAFGWSTLPGHRCAIGYSPNLSAYISPDHSKIGPPENKSVPVQVQVPLWMLNYIRDGKTVLGAAVLIYGISGIPSVKFMNLTIEIGQQTTSSFVETRDFYTQENECH